MKGIVKSLLVFLAVIAVLGLSTAAFATALPQGPWTAFNWNGTAPTPALENPFTFTAPSGGAVLAVTDCFIVGDAFQVLDNLVVIGTTPIVPDTGASGGSDANVCFADGRQSHATFNLGAGAHSITINVTTEATGFTSGSGFIKWDNPPTAIPTMNEWGMIIFMLLAGFGSIYFLKRQRKV